MRLASLLLLAVFAGWFGSSAQAQSAGSELFSIYATTRDGRVKQSTGFAIGAVTIATAYHSVQGASRIEIISLDGMRSSQVGLLASDPAGDLAILRVPGNIIGRVARLSSRQLSLSENFKMVGSAAGMPNSSYNVQLVQAEPINISRLNDLRGRPLLSNPPQIAVLQIAGIIYGGISGGPLIDRSNRVVGVLGGSLTEGGSYGWATPVNRLEALIASGGTSVPIANVNWRPLRIMSARLRTTEYFVRKKVQVVQELAEFTQKRNRLHAVNNEISFLSSSLQSDLSSLRIAIDVATGPLPNGMRQVEAPLDRLNNWLANKAYSWMNLPANAAKFEDLIRERANLDRSLRQTSSKISSILIRSDLDDRAGQRIERQIEELNSAHYYVATDTFERINAINVTDLALLLRDLSRGGGQTFSDIATARQLSRRLDAAYGNARKYNVAGLFHLGWMADEGGYYADVEGLLVRNYGIAVYVPAA